jgi:RimJ/RimL family protein N-acetyltransferase
MSTITPATDQPWIAPGEHGFLTGDKLYLRAPEEADAAYAAAWRDSPYPIIRQRAEKIINEEFPKDFDRRIMHLVACRRADDIPVGGVTYTFPDDRRSVIRVTANPALGDQAGAVKAEIVRIVVPWLSAEQRRMVVWAELDAPEPEVLAAVAAIGMEPAACFREAVWKDGARHDQWTYQLLHPRWRERLGDPGPGISQATAPPTAVPGSRRVSVKHPTGPLPDNALLVSERLILRLAEPGDGKEISRQLRHETESDWSGGRWLLSAGQFSHWFTESQATDPPGEILFAVVLRQTGELIGGVELAEISHFHRRAETGSGIHIPAYRGQGLGTEAKNLLLEYAFDHLNLHMVTSYIWDYNLRSQAAIRKQGYRDAGRLRWRQTTDEGFADFVMFDLLASEWRERVNQNA